jgi:hypothetical protein
MAREARRLPSLAPSLDPLTGHVPVPGYAEDAHATDANGPIASERIVPTEWHDLTLVFYWITSSARASTDGGIVRPSVFAVLRLITNSNLVGCSTGRSAGLAPLRIRSI